MNRPIFIRFAGPVSILAGISVIVSAALGELGVTLPGWYYVFSNLSVEVALLGAYLYQQGESRLVGLLGLLGAMTGDFLYYAQSELILAVGNSLYALGLVLLAAGFWTAQKFPRRIPVLWILAPLVGMVGFSVKSLKAPLILLSTIFYGLGFILIGVILWKLPGSRTLASPRREGRAGSDLAG